MDWIREHLWETWLIAAVALGMAEMVSMDFILLMLAIACLLAMVAAVLGLPAIAQVAVALVAAVGLLLLLRPSLVRRMHGGPDLKTGPEALIGTSGRALTAIEPGTPGRVKLGGEEWTGLPVHEGDRIELGEPVEVVEIRGATAYVRPALGTPSPYHREES